MCSGMNGPERLRKTLFELSFAGFGGDGPGGAASNAPSVLSHLTCLGRCLGNLQALEAEHELSFEKQS